MNHLYVLSSFETVEQMMEQIEGDYIISESDKPKILAHVKEYFRLKESDTPSVVHDKWAEISKMLDTIDIKVKQ